MLGLVCMISCKTVKIDSDEPKKENIKPAKLVETLVANSPAYKFAEYKFSAEYSVNNELPSNFSGILRVSRDSLIWVSLRSFSVEGVRVLMNPDSVKVMDRINSCYYAEDISALKKLINVDLSFKELQSILLNEFFYYPMSEDSTQTDFNSCNSAEYHCVTMSSQKSENREEKGNNRRAERKNSTVQTIKIVPKTMKIKSIFLEDFETSRFAFVEYDKFEKYDSIIFPKILQMEVGTNEFEAKLKFTISDFEEETELTFPFKIPAKYKKVNLNEKSN